MSCAATVSWLIRAAVACTPTITQVSTTDPDSTYATQGGTPARLGYYDNYRVDNHSCRAEI